MGTSSRVSSGPHDISASTRASETHSFPGPSSPQRIGGTFGPSCVAKMIRHARTGRPANRRAMLVLLSVSRSARVRAANPTFVRQHAVARQSKRFTSMRMTPAQSILTARLAHPERTPLKLPSFPMPAVIQSICGAPFQDLASYFSATRSRGVPARPTPIVSPPIDRVWDPEGDGDRDAPRCIDHTPTSRAGLRPRIDTGIDHRALPKAFAKGSAGSVSQPQDKTYAPIGLAS